MADEKREQVENAFMQWWKAKLGPEDLGWPYETSYFAFHAGHAALAAARSEWKAIETVEDLPKESGHYIWQTKDGEVGCGAFHPKLHVDEIMRNCVAYMPLPQPYQRQSSLKLPPSADGSIGVVDALKHKSEGE